MKHDPYFWLEVAEEAFHDARRASDPAWCRFYETVMWQRLFRWAGMHP